MTNINTNSEDPAARSLMLTPASEIPIKGRGKPRPEWGPWNLDGDVYVLWTDAPGYRYEVDLEQCTTSAQVLDWICQVARKEWPGRDRIIAGLVTAVDDVLTPQAHLCSCGQSGHLSKSAIRKLVTTAKGQG